jgi:hypothetical protein
MKGKLSEVIIIRFCSGLLDYITNHISETVEELHVFSDSSPGQNRNHVPVRFVIMLAANQLFNRIFQYFPVRGHFSVM